MRVSFLASFFTCAFAFLVQAEPGAEALAQARLALIKGDYDAAFPVIRAAAEAGNAAALNMLGAAHEEGRGVPQDSALALSYFERAAKGGEVRARHNLGSLHANGSGTVPQDRKRAKREFRLAAAAGYAPSMTALGQLLETQEPPDLTGAADWYEKAHEAGDAVATANLANAHVTGKGRSENWVRARLLYTEAASKGLPRAFNDLGVMHEYGYGVHADYLTAYAFYLRSAELGYAKAGANLSTLAMKARFPFMRKDVALGYCYWSRSHVAAEEQDAIAEKCSAVEKTLGADRALMQNAQVFAEQLAQQLRR